MFNTGPECGLYEAEKQIDPAGPAAICPHCGHSHPFRQLPLFVLTGASGAGKSVICRELAAQMTDCVFLEVDIFWRPEFNTPEDEYRAFRDLCLRTAKNVGQAGRPVVLCGSAIPAQYEACPERRYFAEVHYLALVCEEDELVKRLQARPSWRHTSSPDVLADMTAFNRWFIERGAHTSPPITLLDNTDLSVGACVDGVRHWILDRVPVAVD